MEEDDFINLRIDNSRACKKRWKFLKVIIVDCKRLGRRKCPSQQGRCETRRVLMRCGFHCEKHFSHKILIFRRNFSIIR